MSTGELVNKHQIEFCCVRCCDLWFMYCLLMFDNWNDYGATAAAKEFMLKIGGDGIAAIAIIICCFIMEEIAVCSRLRCSIWYNIISTLLIMLYHMLHRSLGRTAIAAQCSSHSLLGSNIEDRRRWFHRDCCSEEGWFGQSVVIA